MKKTTLRQVAFKLAIVALVLLSPFGLRAQETLTVHDGTETSQVIPAYIYYFDDYTRSQYVIPATELEDMSGGTINAIKFYTTSTYVPYTTESTVDVYLMEVGYTTMTALEPKANGTIVYQGTLNVVSEGTGGSLTIEFDNSYTYGGGNLLVGIENTTDAGYKGIYFNGETVMGASWGGSNGSSLSSVTGSQKNFIPKTTFEYEPGATGGCAKPGQITLGTAGTTQYPISWTAGGEETSWNVYLTQEGSPVAGYNPLVVNTTPSCTFSGLTAGTTYDVAIEAICGSEVSAQRTKSFTTALCEASDMCEISIYRTDSYDDSWNGGSIAIMQNGNLVATVDCPSSSSGTTVNYTVCKGVPVSFVFTRGNYPDEIGVTITDGGGEVVYEATSMSSVSAGTFLTIGNACPSCYKVLNLTHSDETTDGVTLTWEADTRNDVGVTYTIFNVTDNVVYASGVTATSQIVSGLNENTPYEFTVTTDCGSGDLAEAATVNFTTQANCPAPTATLTDNSVTAHGATIQWNDMGSTGYNVRWQVSNSITVDFESGSLPDGWTANTIIGSSGVQSNQGRNNSYGFRFNYQENGATLVSPVLSGTENGVNFSFYYRRNSDSYAEGFKVGYNTDGSDEFTYGDEISVTNTSSWLQYENAFPAGTKRIAIQYVYHDAMYLHIDDIDITIPNDDWTTVNDITNTDYPITGLTAETRYLAQVQSVCEEDVSSWSESVSFTTTIACPAPTALTNGTPSPSEVELTWVKNGEETEWQICINNNEENLVDVAEADVNVNSETSVVTYTLTDLTPSTSYETKVRANCGDVDGPSAWTSPVSFTTQAACPTPVLSADGITNITAHTADVEWSNFTDNTNYEISYRTSAYFDGVSEEFGTSRPTDWTMYTGLLSNVMNGTALSSTTYGWTFGTGNGVFDNHARANIYGTSSNRWLVTPAMTVPAEGVLNFDMALTVYTSGSSASPTAGSQADDKFVVLITTDERATWEILRQWDNAGSEYVYDEITNAATGEHVTIDLSAYEGLDVQVAFYGESTVSGGDNNLHIDNVGVGVAVAAGEWETEELTENSLQLTNLVAETRYDVKVAGYCDAAVAGESATQTFTTTIACPAPTTLAAAANADDATTSVDLTWVMNGAETDWQLCINGDETNPIDINEGEVTITDDNVAYTLTGLIPGQVYTFKVRANCEASVTGDGTSDWSNTVSIQTVATCTEPTAFNHGTPDVHSVDLTWTEIGTATQWQLCVNDDMENLLLISPTIGEDNNVSYTLSGLTANTPYSVKVRAYCAAGDGNQSPWVGPTEFRTACEAITTFPWSENFESYAANTGISYAEAYKFNNPCWVNVHHLDGTGSNGSMTLFQVCSNTQTGNSTNKLELPDMRLGTQTKLRLPEMTLPGDNYQFTIDVLRNASGVSSSTEGVRVYASTDGEIEGATELGFLYRNCNQTDNGVVTAESNTGWYTYEFPIPFSGTCYIILLGESQYGSATYMDNFVVEVAPTCRKPYALMLDNPSARTAHTATLKWTNGEEGQTAWQIAYSTNTTDFTPDNDFTPDETTTWLVDATTNPFTINGLNANTPYRAYVRANCGTDDGLSNWSVLPATFTTLAGNNAPTGLAVPDISVSSSSAIATWNANAANELHQEYELYISTDATAPTAESTPSYTTNETSYTFTDLDPETEYFVWVRDNCGTDGNSAWAGPASFTTQAACPTPVLNASGITNITAHTADVEWSNYTENTNYEVSYRTAAYFDGVSEEFGTTTPTGWARYNGLLSNVMNGTALTSATSGWSFSTGSGVFDNHAKVNLYGSSCNKWLVTPALTVPENGALTFDMALTAYSGTLAAPETSGTDDKFVVLITTDEMATWTVLREWNNSGSDYVLNDIAYTATGENVMIDLGEYVDQTVQVAFYGESTISNADNYLHIDNVGVGVAVAAGDWETESVTENSLQLTNLVAETSYDVKVAGYCDEAVGGESATQTFTTEAFCPAPTNVAYSDVTPHGATITWEGEAANHVIEYRTVTTVDVDYTYDFEDGMQGWTTIDADGHGDAWYLGDNNNAHNGTYSMQTNYNPNYDHQDYLVSPQIALGGSISFYAKKAADWLNDRFRVYLSTTSNTSASDFTIELTNGDVSPSVTYDLYSYDLSNYSGMGYVAIVYTAPSNQYFISIDDINITATVVSGYGEWQTVDNATSPYELNILNPETNYEVTVVGDCGATTSPANDTVGFTTLEACGVPTAFTLGTITTNEATFSWTAGNGNESWMVYVKKHADAEYPTEYTSATTATATITNLDAGTTYDVKIVPDCDATKVLEVVNAFTTECETTVVDADNSFFEGFEGTTFPPNCWSVGDPSNYNTNWQGSAEYTNTGSVSAFCNFNGPIYLYTPILYIDGTTATLSFSSYNTFASWYGNNSVLVSVNGGDWTPLWSPESVSESWVVTTIDMTAYVGQNIQLCFKYEGDGANGWYIDDVELYVPSSYTKAIEANKWYAISSPVHNSDNDQTLAGVTNLTTGTYDLYSYSEGTGTWMNQKAEGGFTVLEQGKGYIYRHGDDATRTLTFNGDYNSGNINVGVTALCEDNDLNGFNLIGNPYMHTISYNYDHYTLSTNGTWLAHENGTIGVAEGFMVKVGTTTTSITFPDEPASKGSYNAPAIAFTVGNGEFEDVAYARFANGEGLPKIGHLAANAPMLSIPVEGRRYAIANLGSDCQSFDMNFRGTGEYTITASNLDGLGYCHLVDRKTGADIDLLRQPAYTFNATGSDAGRFMVMLAPDAQESASGNFAYTDGRNWTVEGNGTLQIFDVLGRRVMTKEVSSQLTIPTSEFPATGVYILRLGEKSQKIVVK